jgi:hypothetical protein
MNKILEMDIYAKQFCSIHRFQLCNFHSPQQDELPGFAMEIIWASKDNAYIIAAVQNTFSCK